MTRRDKPAAKNEKKENLDKKKGAVAYSPWLYIGIFFVVVVLLILLSYFIKQRDEIVMLASKLIQSAQISKCIQWIL